MVRSRNVDRSCAAARSNAYMLTSTCSTSQNVEYGFLLTLSYWMAPLSQFNLSVIQLIPWNLGCWNRIRMLLLLLSCIIVSDQIVNSVCWSHALVNGPTSKRPASDGGLCIGQLLMMWSAVCSGSPHSHAALSASPHFFIRMLWLLVALRAWSTTATAGPRWWWKAHWVG